LQYDAWQKCDTSNFRDWGGMVPVVQDGGFTEIVDVLYGNEPSTELSVDNVTATSRSTALLKTALFRAIAGNLGLYAFAADSSTLVPFKISKQYKFEIESCDRSGTSLYNNDFCYDQSLQYGGNLNTVPESTKTPLLIGSKSANCGSYCGCCKFTGTETPTPSPDDTCTSLKCMDMFDRAVFPLDAWAKDNTGNPVASAGCGPQGFTSQMAASCKKVQTVFTYDGFCASKSPGMRAVQVFDDMARTTDASNAGGLVSLYKSRL
jgi:hypothetical protein